MNGSIATICQVKCIHPLAAGRCSSEKNKQTPGWFGGPGHWHPCLGTSLWAPRLQKACVREHRFHTCYHGVWWLFSQKQSLWSQKDTHTGARTHAPTHIHTHYKLTTTQRAALQSTALTAKKEKRKKKTQLDSQRRHSSTPRPHN